MLIDERKHTWEKTEPLYPKEGGRRKEQMFTRNNHRIANFT